jgi:hypothetical protein
MLSLCWDTLIGNIKDRVCVPFLGAGACHGTLPSGAELADVVTELVSSSPFPFPESRTDLAKVSQFACAALGDSPYVKRRVAQYIEARVAPIRQAVTEARDRGEDVLEGKSGLPRIHCTLAKLGLPLYLTTNYDDLLEIAIGPKVRSEICRWNPDLCESIDTTLDRDPTANDSSSPVVFHLHGSAKQTGSLVLTEDDYIEFLLNVSPDVSGSTAGRGHVTLPAAITRALRKKSLVFIGYSLSDVNFLVLLRGLLSRSDRVLRLAVYLDPKQMPKGCDPDRLKRSIEEYFAWKLELAVFWGSAEQFANELATRLGGVQ